MAKILFLAANPLDTDPLQLGEEMRAIDQALQQAEFRDQFQVESHWAVRVDDLQSLLLRYQPEIVHFSGHGSDASEIVLQDSTGQSVIVPADALSQLFRVLRENIRCVVLNACYTAEQATGISAEIDTVIGMSDAISDDAARAFAAAFYRGLGYGKSVAKAFDLGCNAIDLASMDEGNKPALLGKADPETVHFSDVHPVSGSKEQELPWWDRLSDDEETFPFGDLLDNASGDVIVANVGDGARNIAIGKNIQQSIVEVVGESTPNDGMLIQQALAELRENLDDSQMQQAQFPLQLLETELLKTDENEQPSGSAIMQAGDFLLTNVPNIGDPLASLFAQDAVARAVGQSGQDTVTWLQERFA